MPKQCAVYMRVSTEQQKHDSQRHDLENYVAVHGFDNVKWYVDAASGKNLDRPEFQKLQTAIQAGRVHTVVVYALDRLARSIRDGVNTLADWCERGVRVVSLREQLDLSGTTGHLIASVLFGLAELERQWRRERSKSGQAAAKARGVHIGRPPGRHTKWHPAKKKVDIPLAVSLREQGIPVAEIAQRFGCSRPAVYNALRSAQRSEDRPRADKEGHTG